MRFQAVVDISVCGVSTCETCGVWDRCLRVSLEFTSAANILKDNRVEMGTFCLKCLSREPLILEKDVELIYGKSHRRRIQKKAKRSEKKTTEETGGVSTGHIPHSGDSQNSKYLFEDKTKTGKNRNSYRLTQQTVLKGRDQAIQAGLVPVFRIHLKDVSIGVMLWDDLVKLVQEDSQEDD